jgi:hypothetical protein
MNATNKCPHPKCERAKPRDQYACRFHWMALPQSIRRKIWEGYRDSATLWAQADKEAQEFWFWQGAKRSGA